MIWYDAATHNPPIRQIVLVWCHGRYELGVLDVDHQYSVFPHPKGLAKVTHWAFLPSPPDNFAHYAGPDLPTTEYTRPYRDTQSVAEDA
jgi:hypothetical protein